MKKSLLIKPLLNESYPKAIYGKGIYLFDEDGKRYLDGSSGAVTAGIGHGVQAIIDAMHEQAKKVSFVYRSQFTSEPAERLAEKLNELLPGGDYWSFFVNSGSEATETAMKIAIQYWQEKGIKGKHMVLSRWMSYHGITLGALSMSGHVGRRERFVPLLEDFPSASPPYCYRCPFQMTYPSCQLMCAHELDLAIRRIGAEHIAAFIAEPVIGAAGGAIVPPDGYYEKIKEICDKYQILFIADEVMTGMGRTGKMFAMEHWQTIPDMIVLGKGLSAGYTPIAAVLVSEKLMEPIFEGSKSIMSGHTFSANPQSTAIALAVLEYILSNDLVENAENVGDYLLEQLKKVQLRHQIIGDVRGKGLLTGVELVTDVFSKVPFSKELNLTNYFVKRAAENGLLVYPSAAGIEGEAGDAILIAPPLTITKQQIDELITLFEKTLHDVENDLQMNGFINSAV